MDHDQQPPRSRPEPTGTPALPFTTRTTIWHTQATQQPGGLSGGLARRLLDTFTTVGTTIVDLDEDATLHAAATAMG